MIFLAHGEICHFHLFILITMNLMYLEVFHFTKPLFPDFSITFLINTFKNSNLV